jgi:putative transposase
MKSKRSSDEQIIAVLKEADAGAKTKELCRRHGISEATFYNWKAKYAGMTVSEVRRLKELEAENSKLKRLLAEAELDKAALKDLLGGKCCGAISRLHGTPSAISLPCGGDRRSLSGVRVE